ncbi:hypothetical protein GF324_13680 [bacterium]|nr:hypothetical protein [bacterium]
MCIRIDSARNIGYITPQDELSVERGKELVQAFLEHEHFQPDMASVWDLSYVDVTDWDRSAMIAFGKWLTGFSQQRGKAQTVLIAPSDSTYGLARMLENWGDLDNYALEVVRTPEEADEWLRAQGF